MTEEPYKYHVDGSVTHMWRAVLVWEDPDGSRVGIPTKQVRTKGAATQAAKRERSRREANSMHMKQRERFVSYRIERSPLSWETFEVDGEAVS